MRNEDAYYYNDMEMLIYDVDCLIIITTCHIRTTWLTQLNMVVLEHVSVCVCTHVCGCPRERVNPDDVRV